MSIDDQILLNQLAQNIVERPVGMDWFVSKDANEKRRILQELAFFAGQASPRPEDGALAIERSGLNPRATPCVLLSKGELGAQLAKIINLPERDLPTSFWLLVTLFAVADERRRSTRPLDPDRHWWHRDLRSPEVVGEIRRTFLR